MPIKVFSRNRQTLICSYNQHHSRMSKFFIISCIVGPRAFTLSHQQYTWQTASQTKSLKHGLETASGAGDSAVLIPLSLHLPASPDSGGQAWGSRETWANTCSALSQTPSALPWLLQTGSKTSSPKFSQEMDAGVRWTPGVDLRDWVLPAGLYANLSDWDPSQNSLGHTGVSAESAQ